MVRAPAWSAKGAAQRGMSAPTNPPATQRNQIARPNAPKVRSRSPEPYNGEDPQDDDDPRDESYTPRAENGEEQDEESEDDEEGEEDEESEEVEEVEDESKKRKRGVVDRDSKVPFNNKKEAAALQDVTLTTIGTQSFPAWITHKAVRQPTLLFNMKDRGYAGKAKGHSLDKLNKPDMQQWLIDFFSKHKDFSPGKAPPQEVLETIDNATAKTKHARSKRRLSLSPKNDVSAPAPHALVTENQELKQKNEKLEAKVEVLLAQLKASRQETEKVKDDANAREELIFKGVDICFGKDDTDRVIKMVMALEAKNEQMP